MMFTLSLTLASNLLLAPPTEEEIKTKIDAAMAFFREKGDDFNLDDPEFHAVLDAQLEGVDPAECDMATVQAMRMLWEYTPNGKPVYQQAAGLSDCVLFQPTDHSNWMVRTVVVLT